MNTTDCNVIHETILKDIVDVATDLKDADSIKGILRGRQDSYRSIAAGSENLTMVFPVICSTNMDISTASMIAKALERKYVAMLQILFSSLCYTDSDNVQQYISKFHTNINFNSKFNLDDILDISDKLLASESTNLSENETRLQNKIIEEALIKDRDNYKNKYLPGNVSENALSDYKIMNNFYGENTVLLNNNSVTIQEAPRDVNAQLKDIYDTYGKQILPTDIKKANELMPTTMVVNFVSMGAGTPITSTAIVGVKAKLYPASSADINSHLIAKHKDNNWLNKLIRATTREISFFKDFLFAIDKAKFDAISAADETSSGKMWRVLERRSKKSKIRRAIGSVNDARAITAIVINQQDVEYIKKTANIDIDNPNVARKIMESYNLIGFIIVDEVDEYAKFLFDSGDDTFETLSFSTLERESSDSTYKKVVNLMTKMK